MAGHAILKRDRRGFRKSQGLDSGQQRGSDFAAGLVRFREAAACANSCAGLVCRSVAAPIEHQGADHQTQR